MYWAGSVLGAWEKKIVNIVNGDPDLSFELTHMSRY